MRANWDCIAFVLTVGWEERDRADDALADFEGLVTWLADRHLLTAEEVDAFLAQADKQPERAAAALDQAHRLRVLTYGILRTVATGGHPEPAQLDELNAVLRHLLPGRRIVTDGQAFRWSWRMDSYQPDSLLAPLVWSLAELLTSEEKERLKLCEADDCGWLFIDASRNRSRRWCDMSDCGNRAKVRRYRRKKGPAPA